MAQGQRRPVGLAAVGCQCVPPVLKVACDHDVAWSGELTCTAIGMVRGRSGRDLHPDDQRDGAALGRRQRDVLDQHLGIGQPLDPHMEGDGFAAMACLLVTRRR